MGLKDLFGGSESKQISIPVDTTPAELRALRKPFVDTLTSMFRSGGGPSYEGPLVAPITDAERAMLLQLQQSGMGRQGLIEDTIAGRFLPGQEGANPYLDAAIRAAQRPTLEGLEETLSRTLPGRFTQAGQFVQPQGSSAFDRAAAIATRGAADALADIATNISFGAYESERGRQQQAIQLGQMEVDTMIKNLQAQALPRLIEDLGIERGLQEFQRKSEALIKALAIAAGVPIAQQGTIVQGTSQSSRGVIPGLFGSGGPFPGGLGNPFASTAA